MSFNKSLFFEKSRDCGAQSDSTILYAEWTTIKTQQLIDVEISNISCNLKMMVITMFDVGRGFLAVDFKGPTETSEPPAFEACLHCEVPGCKGMLFR